MTRTLRALTVLVSALIATAAFADPPAHAKAHGWRAKQAYVGYTGREWTEDYGVVEGTCNRKAVGTVVGAVVGGVIGSQIGEGSQRTVATVIGSVLGAVIGREIGRDLDEGDRACIGHSLELAQPGQSVRWVNETTNVTYVLTPIEARDVRSGCRKFNLKAANGGASRSREALACRNSEGVWAIKS
ncbi:MAG TPA: glycine zipper 2TM domain-containing protein [Steroidobacter sp.]|jgi:surface antigen|nr:glycine zipper 2TM domain-containing protein [Steroidobacter sp.]